MTDVQFTVAVPFHDVAAFLPGMLRSLDQQTYGVDRLQIILIDDGSQDDSLAIAQRWAAKHRNVVLLRQENLGPAVARNRAIELATGEWFTSVDSDDIIDAAYFAEVAHFLSRDTEQRASALTARIYLLDDQTGRYRDKHPLGHKYRFGTRIARLADEPEAFILGTPFLRTEVLRANNLRYDARVKPTFEDGHLIGRYLAHFDDPAMGIVASAVYYYRKRTDQSSLVQSSWEDVDRFLAVPEHGYLNLFQEIHRVRGDVPTWAQFMVLYDVVWYLKEDLSMRSKTAWIPSDVSAKLLDIFERVLGYVDAESIERFTCNPMPWKIEQALLVRFKDDGVRPRVFRWGNDGKRAQFTVLSRGKSIPDIRVFVDGVEAEWVRTGTRLHSYFSTPFMQEVSLRVPLGKTISVWVDAVPSDVRRVKKKAWGKPPRAAFALSGEPTSTPKGRWGRVARVRRSVAVARLATGRSAPGVAWDRGLGLVARVKARRKRLERARWVEEIKRRAGTAEVRERYRDAWIVMDRPLTADDNGEHLYRHLITTRPDINAYFLLDRGSVEWPRLEREGFRLVAYGSDEAALLALHAVARISSDATARCMYPVPEREFGKLPGIFVFLQHGVLKDDISRWLEGKNIAMLVTTTEDEYRSFVGSESPYALTDAQVVRTGLARYDALLGIAAGVEQPANIFVMPTWRRDLRELLERTPHADRRAVFDASEFGAAWRAVLTSERLRRAAEHLGGRVRFVLHPNLEAMVPDLSLPSWVDHVRAGDLRFQEELASAAVFVTDYTSVAFDAAYLGVPVHYFQFDADSMFDGSHPLRRGYFDYHRDGLGPVSTSPAGLLDDVEHTVREGKAREPYLSRARDAFPERDGKNCSRIVAEIEARTGRKAA